MLTKPIISADSHITEPPDTYTARIDKKFKDRAPHIVRNDRMGDVFVIDGLDTPIPMGLVAAAGKPPDEIRVSGVLFEELHRSGWDPQARLADQDRDGVAGEIIYPTDHAYKRHRNWLPAGALSKLPSEYFREHIYLSFQDDWVAFQMTDMCNPRRLMWANDFPHGDSTWPWSQDMLKQHTTHLTPDEKDWILHDNVAELYQLPL